MSCALRVALLILPRSHFFWDPRDKRVWVMEDSCRYRHPMGFNPWLWDPTYARESQVRTSYIDIGVV
jgi:hypothetical protein